MTKDMMDDYRQLKGKFERLFDIPPEKRPKTLTESIVVREAKDDCLKKMKAIARRLTYDEKKELGLLARVDVER